jgi:hypothetical protein
VSQDLLPQAAMANLAGDDYARASELWERWGQERLRVVLDTVLATLPGVTTPGVQGDAWPVLQIVTAAESLGRWIPDWELSRWHLAMNELESGRNRAAERHLEQVLESNPSALQRPQIAMYLTMLTGSPVAPGVAASPVESSVPPQRAPDRPPSPALPLRAPR